MVSHFMQSPTRVRPAAKQRTNATIRPDILEEARALGINLSQAFERGLIDAIREARTARWLDENRDALDSYNSYVKQHGLPLEKHRIF